MTAMDLLYTSLTIGFFALMLAYLRFCVRLGHADPDAGGSEVTR